MTRARVVIPAAVAAALFASSAAVGAPPIEPAGCAIGERGPVSNPIPPAERIALAFENGRVTGVSEGGVPVPLLSHRPALSVRLVGGTPNLVAGGDFEAEGDGDDVPDGWSFGAGAPSPAVDPATSHSGSRSIRISSPATATSAAFQQEIAVRPGTFYVLAVWIRTDRIRPVVPTAIREPTERHSPVRVDVQQLAPDGSILDKGSSAYGYTDTSDWSRQSVGFRTAAGVDRVRIRGLLREGSGTAWFDDVSLSELFRGAAIDVTAKGGLVPGTDLSLRIRSRDEGGAVIVDGSASSAGGTEQALQATFTVPIDGRGWQWGDHARRSRTIEAGRYSYETTSSLQTSSRYPFGAVFGDGFGIAVGVPMSEPRMFRVSYDTARGLSITFDLGVSPSATALGARASFSFVVYGFDPAWGFRAATERYYHLFPESFVRRTEPRCEGAWFFAPPLFGLPARDLGLGLNTVALGRAPSQRPETWGTRYLPFDEVTGIYATAYGQHWAYYQPLPSGSAPTYDEVLAGLEEAARSGGDTSEASAALRSTARDQNGRLYFERYREYLAYYQNLDPLRGVPSWTDAVERHQVDRAIRLAVDAGATLAGLHLDSTSGMRRWGAADDYDRTHWAAASIPLTFSYDSGLVVERGIFPMYSHLAGTADLAHRRGMIVSANFNGDEARTLSFVGADRIDYYGLEQGLADRVTRDVSLDQFAMLKRTLAYHKPISTLDHRIGEGELSDAEIDRRLQQNLFYGIFAGAFDAPLEADGGGGLAVWTAGDAPGLWARYTPIFRDLAAAGWEPVTFARSSNHAVWVERFGSPAGGDLLFTLHNETSRAQRFALAVDLDALGASPPAILSAVERITGAAVRISVEPAGGGAALTMSIPPRSTRVIAVTAAP